MAVVVLVGPEGIDHEVVDLVGESIFVFAADLHAPVVELELD